MLASALRLVREEGFRGLFRGVEVQVVRGCLGAGKFLSKSWALELCKKVDAATFVNVASMILLITLLLYYLGTQLPAYNILKRHVSDSEKMGAYTMDAQSPLTHTFCSLVSAGVSILSCNPADVVRTRIYNQPYDSNGT
jgi:hypothetical protein